MKPAGLIWILIVISGIVGPCRGQIESREYYDYSIFKDQVDSIRTLNDHLVQPMGDGLELATMIALMHYPELKGNRIKIKYKKNVRHPITASWAFGNIFKFRKKHTYVLLLHPDSWVVHIDLNGQVGAVGHEMAHFAYYREHAGINMLWWGLKYLTSRRFRTEFERAADFSAVDHKLGWQMLDASFYTNKKELLEYMSNLEMYQN